MKRREFIALLGGAAATSSVSCSVFWPPAARAQQSATRPRMAMFHPAIPTTHLTETGGGSAWRAFFAELRRLGYVEGQNLIIERYSAEGHHERMREGWEGSSGQSLREAGDGLGISLVFMLPQQGTPSEIERVFAAMEQQRPDAVLVSGEGDLYANRQLIAELAEKHRLPVMCPYRDYVEAGGLMAYAVDLAELLRRMADNVHQILKGAKPGEIPIYQRPSSN